MAKEEEDTEDIINVNVGVLGHVDSGKTSLVKSLSTLLSTAALDKSKQSRQRGMTLDLGFSCFYVDGSNGQKLQMTLVDCPGHASLIRTIIGGAQIIDMVLLVVDAFKGWQAQTTECLVLAELTSPRLVVALNKIDLIDEKERDSKLEQVKREVRARLAKTARFANAPLIGVSAYVGGEKVAADTGNGSSAGPHLTYNLDQLVETLKNELPPPNRSDAGDFYFSIDHCFPIRGQGTVLTGTVLSGSIAINSMLEFPTLGLVRKVKSIQMFRRKVARIHQGDRAGICVSNLDANLLERGIAAAPPGAVPLLKSAVGLVRKIPYYQGTLSCGSKFHVSVGHTTVMASMTFFGAQELLDHNKDDHAIVLPDASTATNSKSKTTPSVTLIQSSLVADKDVSNLPRLQFDFAQDFIHQDMLLESLNGHSNLLHWALLEFQTPVHCPLDSLIIGSRLDDTGDSSSACRLAFAGRLIVKIDLEDIPRIRLYTPKEKRGHISRLGDPHRRQDDNKVVRYEVFGSDLFKKETNIKPFVGMRLVTETGEVGEIKSSFGTSGKFRVYFPAGTEAKEGDSLVLKFNRFAHDPQKAMHQDIELPKARVGARLEIAATKMKKKVLAIGHVATLKGDVREDGKYPMAIVSGFFGQEINIREKVGMKVRIPATKEEGEIAGSFGKAGKCKVSFEAGVSAEVGSKAELLSS